MPALKIGYARVSTKEQNVALQVNALRTAGCKRIYREKLTGVSRRRPVLNAALARLRPGDTLIVWKLDRLGRSFRHLVDTIQSLEERRINFHSISDNIDTTCAHGKLLCHILGAIAEFERALIVERTVAGLDAARRNGTSLGRPCILSQQQIKRAHGLARQGHSIADLAIMLKVSKATVWRSFRKAGYS